jgi:hypothetical protein
MLTDRLDRIRGATRKITTGRGQKLTEAHLVAAHRKNQQRPHYSPAGFARPPEAPLRDVARRRISFARNESTSTRNSSNDARYALGSARITMSIPVGEASARRAPRILIRASSRTLRLSRFLSTAECPYLGTTNPIRQSPRVVIATRASRSTARSRLPSRAAARRSLPRVSRCRRGKRRSSRAAGSGAGVLRRELDRQPLAAFPATAAQNFTPPPGRHPLTESVCANASLVAGTIRRLTHNYSKKQKKLRVDR